MTSGQLIEPSLRLRQVGGDRGIPLRRREKTQSSRHEPSTSGAEQLRSIDQQPVVPVLSRQARRAREPAQSLATAHAEDRPVQDQVLPSGELRVEPCADLEQSVHAFGPPRRLAPLSGRESSAACSCLLRCGRRASMSTSRAESRPWRQESAGRRPSSGIGSVVECRRRGPRRVTVLGGTDDQAHREPA
jgi:hypothetical protein